MELLSGAAVGLLGSLHCVGMCGPLVLALPVPQGSRAAFYAGRVLYNLGRTVTYAAMGLLAGSIGRFIVLGGWQQALSLTAGGLLLLSVALPSLFAKLSARFSLPGSASERLRTVLAGLFRRRPVPVLFVIGVVNGLLPCGLVYVALAAAASTGGAASATLFMTGFGLGTIPLLFGLSLAGRRLGAALRGRLSALVPVLTAAVAVIIILRGMNLGIPYLSPALPAEPSAATAPSCH